MVEVVGFTLICDPEPDNIPPQLPIYQFHIPPVPTVPPDTLKVLVEPEHTELGEEEAVVADTEMLSITIVELTQVVVLH